MRLKGKVALITGGARGQGAAEAKLFVKEGAKVVIADILDEEGKKLEAEIAELGGECFYTHLDVSDSKNWDKTIEKVITRFGKIDILVNNAGIAVWGTNDDTTEEIWDTVMDVNAKGVFLGTQHVIPEMKKSGGGSIINISSISGLVGQPTIQPVYNASKGAVRIFTKSTAVQYGSYGIRANSIHPGAIDTDMISHRIQGEENRNRIKTTVPLQRVAKPIEIAYGALFLASDESSYMTGSEMVIDGGVTAGAPNTSATS
ncbi:glucose 1-dehydrogenase [Chloroflexi bacterium]|nr:glucose 1-dehydrogenase [Chloroflexota bacterium]